LLSSKVCLKADGYTNEGIEASKIKKGDKIVEYDSGSGVGYVVQYPDGKDNSKLKMPDIKPNYEFYVCRPKPAYYTLLPLTLPVDVVILPYTAYKFCTTPPVSH